MQNNHHESVDFLQKVFISPLHFFFIQLIGELKIYRMLKKFKNLNSKNILIGIKCRR